MRHFSVELLKESPSPALRTCAGLAQVQVMMFILNKYIKLGSKYRPLIHSSPSVTFVQPYMARELFAAGFVSCWVQLSEASQNQLLQSLNNAFLSPNIPPEILAAILNLVCLLLRIVRWLVSKSCCDSALSQCSGVQAEFMEQDEKKLNIDIRTLGGLAEKVSNELVLEKSRCVLSAVRHVTSASVVGFQAGFIGVLTA